MSQVLGLRIEDDLMAAVESFAAARSKAEGREVKKSEAAVEILGRHLGPAVPAAVDGTPVLRLSTSELVCMDQLAERSGVSRVELMRRFLSERLRLEFVNERNGKLLKP
jgi:hypothetical protein